MKCSIHHSFVKKKCIKSRNGKVWCCEECNSWFNSELSPLFTCKISRLDNYRSLGYEQFSKPTQNGKLNLRTPCLWRWCALCKGFFPRPASDVDIYIYIYIFTVHYLLLLGWGHTLFGSLHLGVDSGLFHHKCDCFGKCWCYVLLHYSSSRNYRYGQERKLGKFFLVRLQWQKRVVCLYFW